jgi:hypothetical protein
MATTDDSTMNIEPIAEVRIANFPFTNGST